MKKKDKKNKKSYISSYYLIQGIAIFDKILSSKNQNSTSRKNKKPDITLQEEEYLWRKITRWYSKNFHVPLNFVREKMNFAEVLRDYYEENFDSIEKIEENADFRNYIIRTFYPDIEEQIAKEDIEWLEKELQIEEQKKKQKQDSNHAVLNKLQKQPKPKELELKFDENEEMENKEDG